jgi:hypothetical protein
MFKRRTDSSTLDENAVFGGFFWGVLIGAILMLVNSPRRGLLSRSITAKPQVVPSKAESALPADPLADSAAAGKAAARRRLAELGVVR